MDQDAPVGLAGKRLAQRDRDAALRVKAIQVALDVVGGLREALASGEGFKLDCSLLALATSTSGDRSSTGRIGMSGPFVGM